MRVQVLNEKGGLSTINIPDLADFINVAQQVPYPPDVPVVSTETVEVAPFLAPAPGQ